MTILVECAGCNGQFRVDPAHAGKRIRCPSCQGAITVPVAERPAAPPRPAVPPRQERARPVAAAPQPAPASRRPSAASPEPRRSRSGVFDEPLVRQPRDQNRYTPASGTPWKIILASAGVVVTLVIGGMVLFNVMQGMGTNRELAQSNSTSDSQTLASGGSADAAHSNSKLADNSSTTPSTDNGKNTVSTFDNKTNSANVSAPVTSPATQPSMVGGIASGSSSGPGAVISANPATNLHPSTLQTLPENPATSSSNTPATASIPSSAPSTVLTVSETELSIDELFSRVEGSVVRVNVSSSEGAGNGSGFVIDAAGIIVTNYHVIAGANRAWVEFANKDRIDVDGLLYMDHKKDIAILKFDATRCKSPLVSIPVATVQPRKGIAVVAIGAPLGLDMSVTEGIVSAIRTAKELEESIDLTGHSGTWVQTTAAISPGNSGGPLITKRGEVVAINTLSLVGAGAQALNFGISSEDILQAMTELKSVPIPLSPLTVPDMQASEGADLGGRDEIHDVSGTPQGDKLLANLRKLVIVFLPLTFNDPHQTVVSAVESEARQTLEKAGIEESLISNDKAALLMLMKLERSGTRLVLYITAHIIVQDDSSGRPQAFKIWERTGEVGSISQQSILSGNLPANLRKEIKDFFAKMRSDILKARKTTSETTN
ncbi:MAG: hypothetical protein DWI29_02600 [Planctomycetota bacterium]|nr:MAG: hypothetical protein DWI29_02600 [Planctomycetota bacterium]